MHTPPFHRRILPWIFAIVFLAMAPSVIFYTAGYRWNPKKGMIERFGTVIVDTTPTGADIDIDGRPLTEKTPYTIQNMAPGLHRFSVSTGGYTRWTKDLDVYPEQVTFVNGIWLWKTSSPVERLSVNATALSGATDDRTLLILTASTPTRAVMFNTITNQSASSQTGSIIAAPVRVSWSGSTRYALIENDLDSWIVDATNVQQPAELPRASYRWSGNDLVGSRDRVQTRIRLRDFSISQETLPAGTVDLSDTAELRASPNGGGLVFVSKNTPQTGLILPPGHWTFWSEENSHTLLRDGERWLSLQEKASPPEYHIATGDIPRPFTVKRQTRYLLVNDNELWLWDPLNEPELLLRQSDRIIGAEWHHDGGDVFAATEKNIFALNLDSRDGRIVTDLGSFDDITGFAVSGKSIYVAGTTSTRSGVWELNVE